MKINIFYAGLDINTLYCLYAESDFRVIGVARIENFDQPTLNPLNLIFKIVYFLRCKSRLRAVELLFLWLWVICSPLSTGTFKRYALYLKFLSLHKVTIVDLDSSVAIRPFANNDIDLIVVNTWGIIAKEIFSFPKFGTVNIHPSKLPQYRGALPTLWSLKNHDSESAVTYLLITAEVDAGRVITQYTFAIDESDDWLSLERKIAGIIQETLIQDLKKYLNKEIIPRAQNDICASKTAKYNAYLLIDCALEKAKDIYNKVNLYPHLDAGVYCFFYFNKKQISIKKISLLLNSCSQNNNHCYLAVRKLSLQIQIQSDTLESRLFRDISFFDSLRLLSHTRRIRLKPKRGQVLT